MGEEEKWRKDEGEIVWNCVKKTDRLPPQRVS